MARRDKYYISDEVLRAEYESVYRYALALCRSEAEAQDITQDTFLRALTSKSRFVGDSSLYTWLCAIAKNLWLDRCRKSGREVSLDEQDMLIPDDDSIEERAADRSTAREIHRILHTLEEPYKEVFSLRVFGQLSFADIAELFGKTESWARVTYHRARKKIADKMRKDGAL
ncbi:MAG: RNA polymerase sigma factor [Ruminococcus sp.]|nr:RNA polymerase sigma factor [Ruminococcus sp.]